MTIREQVTENNQNVLKVLGSVKLPTDSKKFTADGVSKNETSGKLVTNTLTITYNDPIQLENSTGKGNYLEKYVKQLFFCCCTHRRQ